MEESSFRFLTDLLSTPSVSGFEQRAARVFRDRLAPWAEQIRTDLHGNTVAVLNPAAPLRVMLAGHVDQIGFLVNHVNEKGYVYLTAVGGIDVAVILGSRLVVHGRHGPVLGVLGRKAVHLMKPEERDNAKKLDLSELWLDIGATDRAAALEQVDIGDPVTFRLDVESLGNELITAPGLDNKVGAFVVAEALRLVAERARAGETLGCGLYAVATVQEEIGLRGAHTATFGIDPTVGIAVDVGHGTDYPGADERVAGSIKLGAGPILVIGANVNLKLGRIMTATAERAGLAVQKHAIGRATGTDANAMQIARAGIATALISLPCRYMHTPVEVVSKPDLVNAARLIAETVLAIRADENFVPE